MRLSSVTLFIVTFAFVACSNDGFVDPEVGGTRASFVGHSDPLEARYIVVLNHRSSNPNEVRREISELGARYGATLNHVYSHTLFGFAAEMAESDALELAEEPGVAWIEQDGRTQAASIQGGVDWGLDRIDQRNLPLNDDYQYQADGRGVNAYIIDSGIRISHQDFEGRARHGYDAIEDDETSEDCNGHGTHMAGLVGGRSYGVAKGAHLIGVRVLDCSGTGSVGDLIAGLDWVVANHRKPAVANISLVSGISNALDQAVRNAVEEGVTVVTAAGNANADACNFSPARVAESITVGATTIDDARSDVSNRGPCLDLFAPGEGTSAWYSRDDKTHILAGTSAAAAYVTGTAALYLSTAPDSSPSSVTEAIVGSTTQHAEIRNAGNGSPQRLLFSRFARRPEQQTPPDITLRRPTAGALVFGWVEIATAIEDLDLVDHVELLVDGRRTASFSATTFNWNSETVADGEHVLEVVATDATGQVGRASVTVVVGNLDSGRAIAEFDPRYETAACLDSSSRCTSGDRFRGRARLGPERHAPSTIGSTCKDGEKGTYRYDESIERIALHSVTGGTFARGSTVEIVTTVWVWKNHQQNTVDIFHADDAEAPEWTLIESLQPEGPGEQTLTTSLTLSNGNVQAIRAQIRYEGEAKPCDAGDHSDRDDLVFKVDEVAQFPALSPRTGDAIYDAIFSAPVCDSLNLSSCSSGELLIGQGRDESNYPNTLSHSPCADGTSAIYFTDESIEAINVRTLDGEVFRAGADISIEVQVFAWDDGSGDQLDVFYASDADNPVWRLLGRQVPSGGELQTLSVQTKIPFGGTSRHVIRAVFGLDRESLSCSEGDYTDHDDLIFRINERIAN